MSDSPTQNLIARLVPEGARVLDLGCGDGVGAGVTAAMWSK